MAPLTLLVLLAALLTASVGKIFRRCELAQVLHRAGMDGIRGYSLADWLCLAFYESRFDTSAVDHEADGSTDNGIFQINSRLWCEDYGRPAQNLCRMHCSDLLTSNINDDIVCAMQIVQQPRGLGAWLAWRKHCEGRDLSRWVEGCNVGGRWRRAWDAAGLLARADGAAPWKAQAPLPPPGPAGR